MILSDDEIKKHINSISEDFNLNRRNFIKGKWVFYNLRYGDTVIDAGACRGWYTKLYSYMVGDIGSVIAFEPERSNYEYLIKKLRSCKNVTIVKAALANRFEVTPLYVSGVIEAHSIVKGYGKDTQKTTVMSLDQYCKENNISKITHIKMDVEGCDYDLLVGAEEIISKSENISILGEFHFGRFHVSKEDVWNFCQKHNMTIMNTLEEFKIVESINDFSEEMLLARGEAVGNTRRIFG